MYSEQKHYIVCKLKELADELGRVPTSTDFIKLLPRVSINVLFGSFDNALAAAGLSGRELAKEHKAEKPPVIDSPDLMYKVLKDQVKTKVIRLNDYKKIAIAGDIHFPFSHDPSISLFYAIIEKEQPDIIIQEGDLKDLYAQSKFPRSLNVYSPKAEDELADAMAKAFWETVRKLCPKAECFQIIGNHDIRAMKRVAEKWPEGEHLIQEIFKNKYTFEGVTTIYDARESLIISDIAFIHGHKSNLGAHRDFNDMNVVCGHSHRGGVSYAARDGRTLWELNVGYLGDANSKALSYRAQKLDTWTLGMGIIDQFGPRFVHF